MASFCRAEGRIDGCTATVADRASTTVTSDRRDIERGGTGPGPSRADPVEKAAAWPTCVAALSPAGEAGFVTALVTHAAPFAA